jgi:iron(III) transport system ATP-binding protein
LEISVVAEAVSTNEPMTVASDGKLRVTGLSKAYKGPGSNKGSSVPAVKGVSLEVEQGRFLTLLGPSGCGKTTTLRCIAGLERPDDGEILLGDRVLFSGSRSVRVPANARRIGMVFQSYAIWPHMSVFENVAFPLRASSYWTRIPKDQIRERVERVLDAVQLGGLEGRSATALSGGQQQRLALARALVMEPPLLLLDEPLSNLDAKLREGLRFELKRLQRELGITTLYVTHDQTEALSMSNTIAVMRDGLIDQFGTPREIYDRPTSLFTANFIGTSNFIEATVVSKPEDGTYRVEHPAGSLVVTSDRSFVVGDKVVVSIRPERLMMLEDRGTAGAHSELQGVVRAKAFLGEAVDYLVWAGHQEFRLRTDASLDVQTGSEVTLSFPKEHCSLLPTDS